MWEKTGKSMEEKEWKPGGGEITHQSNRVLPKQVQDAKFNPQYTQPKRVLDKSRISHPILSSFYICNKIFESVY